MIKVRIHTTLYSLIPQSQSWTSSLPCQTFFCGSLWVTGSLQKHLFLCWPVFSDRRQSAAYFKADCGLSLSKKQWGFSQKRLHNGPDRFSVNNVRVCCVLGSECFIRSTARTVHWAKVTRSTRASRFLPRLRYVISSVSATVWCHSQVTSLFGPSYAIELKTEL